MPLISIVIPVYNVEPYLKKCLDSVCYQTLKEVEIICVNDASTDNSLAIVKEYAKNDDRIKIIDFKKNQGVSIARNKGIDIAQGEYIGFMDADDYVDLDFYEKLYNIAKSENSDIAKAMRFEIDILGQKKLQELNSQISLNKFNFTYQWTTAIYKNELIQSNKIRFPSNLQHTEDIVFLTHCLIKANKVALINDTNYYYCRHANSLNSEEKKQEHLPFSILACVEILNLLQNASVSEVDEEDYAFLYRKYLTDILSKIFLLNDKNEEQEAISLFVRSLHQIKNPEIITRDNVLSHFQKFHVGDEIKIIDYVNGFKNFASFKFQCLASMLKKRHLGGTNA